MNAPPVPTPKPTMLIGEIVFPRVMSIITPQPITAEFFGFLVTGEYPLVECYAKSTLLTSWMMILVGDPLYNPYAKTPKLKVAQVKPSPKGSHIFPGE